MFRHASKKVRSCVCMKNIFISIIFCCSVFKHTTQSCGLKVKCGDKKALLSEWLRHKFVDILNIFYNSIRKHSKHCLYIVIPSENKIIKFYLKSLLHQFYHCCTNIGCTGILILKIKLSNFI